MSGAISVGDAGEFKRVAREDDGPAVGQWYWVTPDQEVDPEEAEYCDEERARLAENRKSWLGCAMKVGSNFVELDSPHARRGCRSVRVHLENFWTELRHEPNADEIIRQNIGDTQQKTVALMQEVQELTMRLGMSPISAQQSDAQASSGALMVLSGTHDVKAYGNDLVLAKNEQLPALFKSIEEANDELATFSVSLYAGLTEDVVQCCEGDPANPNDKLHVMQRMAFMDEECLANYRRGGMTFKDIEAFDKFMCDPVNQDRILPFPRTLVAMRVRRNKMKRDNFGSIAMALINFRLEEQDKLTYLYIRNGGQVWRLSCDLDFGELIFPDKSVYDPTEPKMVKMRGDDVESFMATSEYEVLKAEHAVGMAKYNAWEAKHPNKSFMDNPHRKFGWHSEFQPDQWAPVDHTNVYFDEVMTEIGRKIKEYNRVALIIQGLFDRSLVLHPHPPVQTWSQGGFDKAVKLVFDGSDTIPFGYAPDFEAYRARCNATMDVGCTTVGQDDFWQRKEAIKEGKRRDNDYRDKSHYRPEHFVPYGNPGPGYIAQVTKFSKARGATFTWLREKRGGWGNETIECSIIVPTEKLFNIDAYKLGDYKQFFADSRTRQNYLQWAPLLLAAEEHVYAAQKRKR